MCSTFSWFLDEKKRISAQENYTTFKDAVHGVLYREVKGEWTSAGDEESERNHKHEEETES
jgi:hypothetical protein